MKKQMVKLVFCDEKQKFLLQKIGAIYECFTVPNFPKLEHMMSHIQQIANRHFFQVEYLCQKTILSRGQMFMVVMCKFGSDSDLFDVSELKGCWKHEIRDTEELMYIANNFEEFAGVIVREKKRCCVLL